MSHNVVTALNSVAYGGDQVLELGFCGNRTPEEQWWN